MSQDKKAEADAVRTAYRELLRPIVMRERESLKQHPEWKDKHAGRQLANTEAEWQTIGGDDGE